MIKSKASVCLAAGLLMMPSAGKAAIFVIDDTNSDETIRVKINDFEGGFFIDGQLVQQGLNNPVNLTFPESRKDFINFEGTWIDLGQTDATDADVAFIENDGSVSDLLGFSYDTDGVMGHLQGFFVSEDFLIPSPNASLWNEASGTLDFSNAFITAQATSDVEVPDSGSGAIGLLTLVGLCGLASRRQMFQRTAA